MGPPYAKIVPLEATSVPRAQTAVFWITAVVVAATRFAARSRTLWDWDEALFAAAIVDYDIAEHRPHPPGFPLYIGIAKLLRPLLSSEFEALRAINLVAALLAFPAAFALARALRFDFTTSWLAGLLFAFFPNVWFFGGTGFSDVPAVVLAMGGAALLLTARERPRSFISGCVVAAAGMAIRPQNALMATYPALTAIWTSLRARRFLIVVVGGLVTLAIVAGAFGGAIEATGSWERYREAVEWHRGYIMSVDSYQGPERPPLTKLLDDFYVDPAGPRPIAMAVVALTLIGLLRARRPAIEALAIFGPFAVFALFMLDHWSANRFSIAYMPLFALCGAEGARVLASGASRAAGARRAGLRGAVAPAVQVILVGVCVVSLATWCWPAVRTAASTESPSHAALRWIHENVAPGSPIVVHRTMWAFAFYGLSEYAVIHTDDTDLLPPSAMTDNLWILSEGLAVSDDAAVFTRPRARLSEIARARYFEVHVQPVTSSIQFSDGWYDQESDGSTIWRWMGGSSRATLPPLDGEALLVVELYLPLDALPAPPVITIRINGVPIDRFAGTDPLMKRSWRITSAETPNVLTIETDRTITPGDAGIGADSRQLGLQLRSIRWSAAEPR